MVDRRTVYPVLLHTKAEELDPTFRPSLGYIPLDLPARIYTLHSVLPLEGCSNV